MRSEDSRRPGRPDPDVPVVERIVLDVETGVPASPRPPVRIFLGTEPAQHRAERIFLWSIEQVRDPARVYEIHLMKNLPGFDARRWLTGFTNYRFAIPDLAGRSGLAIYNDTDQIYLADPGLLFDTPMGSHGFLTVPLESADAAADTSVMLLDCERMASIWNLSSARAERKNPLLARARATPGLRGDLDPRWNARDDDYDPGRPGVLHYTTIHTQPWRPFPERFAYQHNAVARPWQRLEESANEGGYLVYHADRPSAGYRRLLDEKGAGPEAWGPETRLTSTETRELLDLLEVSACRTLLEWDLGTGDRPSPIRELSGAIESEPAPSRYDPTSRTHAKLPREPFDTVVCLQALDVVPDDDVPWVVEELFRHARSAVFAVVGDAGRGVRGADGVETGHPVRTRRWWFDRFAGASARHPDVRWCLCVRSDAAARPDRAWVRRGGPARSGPPRVWVLSDGKPGHTTQSTGLAEALGWPAEVKELRFTRAASVSRRLSMARGSLPARTTGLDRRRSDSVGPPWPDVVIATGWRTAPIARWIGEQSGGHTRQVQLGRQGAWLADRFDAVVTCAHFEAPPDDNRIETLLPLHGASPERLARAAERWPDLFAGGPRPHVLLLLGGATRRYSFGREDAGALARKVRDLAVARGGSVVAVTSPRTGREASDAVETALGDAGRVHRFDPARKENPYLGYLATADVIVVTGDSESMLAETLATDAPVYIHALAEHPNGLITRIQDWIVARSKAQPLSRRGRVRPQQGAEHLCARLVERGLVRPRRNMSGLHRDLVDRGYARMLDGALETEPQPRPSELGEVARRLRRRLALGDA